jgi:hypothetical protein
MVMRFPERVCTAPIPGGASRRTYTGSGGRNFSASLRFQLSPIRRRAPDLDADRNHILRELGL